MDNNLYWTSDAPKNDGYYWRKYSKKMINDSIYESIDICFISILSDGKTYGMSTNISSGADESTLQFAGPIPKPLTLRQETLWLTEVSYISFYVDEKTNDLIILHKEENSLLKVELIRKYTSLQIHKAIIEAMGHLDWDKSFDEVFSKQEYRKAVMNVPYLLIKE